MFKVTFVKVVFKNTRDNGANTSLDFFLNFNSGIKYLGTFFTNHHPVSYTIINIT